MNGCTEHNLHTLKELMDERDLRYSERFTAQQEAVQLARQVADSTRGTVSVVSAVGVIAVLLSVVSILLTLAERMVK